MGEGSFGSRNASVTRLSVISKLHIRLREIDRMALKASWECSCEAKQDLGFVYWRLFGTSPVHKAPSSKLIHLNRVALLLCIWFSYYVYTFSCSHLFFYFLFLCRTRIRLNRVIDYDYCCYTWIETRQALRNLPLEGQERNASPGSRKSRMPLCCFQGRDMKRNKK